MSKHIFEHLEQECRRALAAGRLVEARKFLNLTQAHIAKDKAELAAFEQTMEQKAQRR